MSLSEAIRKNRLPEFTAQEEARGVGPDVSVKKSSSLSSLPGARPRSGGSERT
jgi:hypothetical protein